MNKTRKHRPARPIIPRWIVVVSKACLSVLKALRASLVFVVILVYESIMCIVEAMLQMADPDADLTRSAFALRVVERPRPSAPPLPLVPPPKVIPLSNKSTPKIIPLPLIPPPAKRVPLLFSTPTIISLPPPLKVVPLPPPPTPSPPPPLDAPLPPAIAELQPKILIPEIVQFIPVEIPAAISTPPTPSPPITEVSSVELAPSPASSSSSSSQSINEMSATPEEQKPSDAEVPKTPPPTPAATPATSGQTLTELFKAFAKFGDCKSDGSAITLSNSDKWFKQAQLFDGKSLTTTDTGIYWKQAAKTKRSLSHAEYLKFLQALCNAKKFEINDLKEKLKKSGPPSIRNATHAQSTGAFSRLTDHTKYTGSHRQRFDETGKGRGKAGREDIIVNTGYVNGFKQ